ncbi:MAG: putative integral rane protein [Acidobacteriota bacterium]|jgi:uncharacterized membrane protein|nr:putative integral rane protein [Acidobacteriota bacterium]
MASLFKFLHILMAFWLVAGVFGGIVVRAQTRRAADLAAKVNGLRLASRLTRVYTLPGAILAGLLGFGLVSIGRFGFSARWVQISIVLYLLMLASTLFYLTPRLRRTLAAGEASLASGAPNAEFQSLAAAKLPGILADVNALGILVLTALMVFKYP